MSCFREIPHRNKGRRIRWVPISAGIWHQEASIPVQYSKIWNFSGILWVPIAGLDFTDLISHFTRCFLRFTLLPPWPGLLFLPPSAMQTCLSLKRGLGGRLRALFTKACPDPGLSQQKSQPDQFCYILSPSAEHLPTLTGAVRLARFWAEPAIS